ncbi:hypothetical protein WMY93_029712 [Mugilogobius chulae]|uniref:Alpha-helical coiled-coil rod protein n=1 Tax=Mugilogobius chulae TaxID=88201 RepID=A0AAW0MSJ4_9GOBI
MLNMEEENRALQRNKEEESQLQVEQNEKQALQNRVLALESALTAEKQMVEEAKNTLLTVESALMEQKQAAEEAQNKARELQDCVNTKHIQVQELQRHLDMQKSSFMTALEKSSSAHKTLVENNTEHQNKMKEMDRALNRSEEEKTSALLRCQELETLLKETRKQLQQSEGLVEFTRPNREDRMKLLDLQRQLQDHMLMNCMQKEQDKTTRKGAPTDSSSPKDSRGARKTTGEPL